MNAKYDIIGKNYDATRTADPYLASQLLKHLQPNKDSLYLDIGCGTGNYTSALQKQGLSFIGVDPSQRMLDKATAQNPAVQWRLGTAEATGLAAQSIDGIIGSLTIHHWKDLDMAFSELSRVLKDQGRIVIFTATPQQMEGYWLNAYFPQLLQDSIKQMPACDHILRAMTRAGLKIIKTVPYSIKPDLQDHFLYCGKERPELYFDEHIRNGISSFSALANLDEVKAGLKKLKSDIESGAITSVMKSFNNDLGDYLYVIAEKG